MQKKLEIKDNRGSIVLFVLLSLLFFLIILGSTYVSVKNRERAVEMTYKKIQDNYETNVVLDRE